jgi:Fur family ferric uptake transcriptional regulator
MSWTENVLSHLSGSGHRVTAPRRAILERIMEYNQPFTSEQLFRDLGGDEGPIGRATIYRTVDLLLDDGWLARVHWSASSAQPIPSEHAYVPAERGHHHHMVCRNCGSTITFEGCNIDDVLGGLTRRLNFRIEGHWLEVYGLCQICQRKM